MWISRDEYEALREQRDYWRDQFRDEIESKIKAEGRYEEQRDRMTYLAQEANHAVSALRHKDDVIEELQAEVYELTQLNIKTGKRVVEADVRNEQNIREYQAISTKVKEEAREQVAEATARAEKAEAALAAATRISYVVALHERDVPSQPRHNSLGIAYTEYLDSTKREGEFPYRTPPYRIYALRGDEITADVTDPRHWDERLPVSEKRTESKWGGTVLDFVKAPLGSRLQYVTDKRQP